MDDPHKPSPHTSDIKNVLPDVVHSQQIPSIGVVATDETESGVSGQNADPVTDAQDSDAESISEHIPSNIEDSTESHNAATNTGLLRVEMEQEKVSKDSSHLFPHSPVSDNPSTQEPSKSSTSWPLDVNAASDIHHISEESPIILPLSSDISKEVTQENKSPILTSQKSSENDSPNISPKSDNYLDSLNEESSHNSNLSAHNSADKSDKSNKSEQSLNQECSGSDEIIKLDIRGQSTLKFPFPAAKIIFGPPPGGGSIIDGNMKPIPLFPNLLSPFLIGAGSSVTVEEVFDEPISKVSPSKSFEVAPEKESLSDKIEQSDLLIEEITVDDELKEKESEKDEASIPPKSMPHEETMSFSTMTTEYKTICEEYHVKLVHLENAVTQRDDLIEELTISLQRSVRERDALRTENDHLTNEVGKLQHAICERSHSEHDTVKAELSDFMKYETLIKDDTTKFYSAIMSGGSSLKSSNEEKDMDREEITVNYSKSDLRSSDTSDDFQTGFETKLTSIINKFDEYIEENLRNKLRESLIQVLCDEIGKIRIEADTEMKELETQIQQNKQAYTIETRRLRELLASVKAGNADVEVLRQEMNVKHEKEMENLRTYFEKKCSDMERSYSEEVWRGRCTSPAGSLSSLEAVDAAGDHLRRRTRSAELPSLSLESTQMEQAVKLTSKKYEQQLEELKAEQVAHVGQLQAKQREAVASLEQQIIQLKAHIQTTENTESNVSLYQQDIDLELEKKMEAQLEQRLGEVREDVRREVVNHLQEQLQVLLSDPDAEVSSWPLELVALRDKIHGDAKSGSEKELSSLRDELSGGEDKWKQRRNHSFDQNRHLEEVTKERDELKRVAVSLHHVVGQLVAYCACAEEELNRTVLTQLLARLLPGDADETPADGESRPSTPNLSVELDASAVSRGGKHVHFAPHLDTILADLDEEGIVGCLQQQRDLSADIKRELEHSLRRLRLEAHSLLDLSARLATKNRQEPKMLDSSRLEITELVQELDSKRHCDSCELHRKNMEEAMAECLQRENLLRSDLEAALLKVAELMTSAEVIAEGYGTGPPDEWETGRARRVTSQCGAVSLDSPRAHLSRLTGDVDALQRERDDLHQQLEAANRQLRSTRQFVEEQAGEREAERDEFARRLADLRADNTRLAARLQHNARILSEMSCLRLSHCNCFQHDAHVEQLEAQTRDMNQIITELETRKASTDDDLKAAEEKVALLRDIIANLEHQLEQKTAHETGILEQLEQMKRTIEDRDSKMRTLLGELESVRSERADQSHVTCVKCGPEDDRYDVLLDMVKDECARLQAALRRRTRTLERAHEHCSAACSEPSEDVSLRDRRPLPEAKSPEAGEEEGEAAARRTGEWAGERAGEWAGERAGEWAGEWAGVWECWAAHARAQDAALKRVADLEMQRLRLKEVAQEVRAERDVLQTRMSEQALKISSLSARLQQHRNDADALSHQATSRLSVQLHDALAEVQRLKEDLESKDKQLVRVKQNLDERDKLNEQHHSLYGNSCNPKDKVIILERELSSAQSRIAQLEVVARTLEQERGELQTRLVQHQKAFEEKHDQKQQLLALKLDVDQKEEKSELYDGKTSARTLSDIVSISEFDEQDHQMRRAEAKAQNVSVSGAPYASDTRDKTQLNRTLPPELQKPNMSSLNMELVDHSDLPGYTPRADSLPTHLTSTQNKDALRQYKRNVNETTMFGAVDKFGDSVKHSTAQNIPDNCSMYPNRDVNESKDVTVEPKKINFSLELTNDNKTNEEFTSLRELGITLDIKQANFPDILTQLKHEIKKSRTELENCKSELKNAEEQLCEFPALKGEVEELKGLLENTMATMANDKKFYENQLENFSSNKILLEQRLTELTQEVDDKSNDLHLLKEDILRRENMILELAKEKRNLTNKMTELEVKIDEMKSRNTVLEKYETENHQMREKVSELHRLEQLVSEKNHQIDSLNQHLDRLDDLQRCLSDKTEELDNLKEALEDKSNELYQIQDTVEALNSDIAKVNEENEKLNAHNKELKLNLSKLEKENANASLKLQNSESELERVNSLNDDLSNKIDELKSLTDKLKDKETEIEILHEDIDAFHEEIASLKEQLKIVSRSPSPRSKSDDTRTDRQASSDKKQLVKIRKQISLLQHELDFNKKDLNDKAFELAKAKLDVTELKNNLSQATKQSADKESANAELKQQLEDLQRDIQQLTAERDQLSGQLEVVVARMREETDVSELRSKLLQTVDRCQELESELQDMRELVQRCRASPGWEAAGEPRAVAVRSPTAELERALRDQLHYSHTLDEDIMEQILSASSDEREEIPRLALNTSKSSSSVHSTSSDRYHRLRVDNDKLQLQVDNLESRLKDKDALIAELNRVRDKLVQDWQTSKLRYEAERDNSGRLQLLLDTQKETSESLQNQDSNMIQILKKRLESAMQSELELQQREQQLRARAALLERQLLGGGADCGADCGPLRGQLQHEMESNERLSGSLSLVRAQLAAERGRARELQAALEAGRLAAQRDRHARDAHCTALKHQLADLKRLKHDASVELLRSKELVNAQSATIVELEKKLATANIRQKPYSDALTEIEGHKSELSREIATLKRCLVETTSPELAALRRDKQQLQRELQSAGGGDAIRYLHGRCLRLESCRKALVWQKRYLQRVVAGHLRLERALRPPPARDHALRGRARFKCAALVVLATLRVQFLVRHRHHVRACSATCLLRPAAADAASPLPPARSARTGESVARAGESFARAGESVMRAGESVARRVRGRDVPASPALGEFFRHSPYSGTSPREDPFIMGSPRAEVAAAYLNKLELVSRCLDQAMDASRDVP